MSLYTRFATLPTKLAARGVSVGGPDFTGVRGVSTGLGSPTYESLSGRRLVFVAQVLETFGRTFPEVDVWRAPWLVFALLGVDVQEGDVYTDGNLAYLISGSPVTHYGFVLGPAVVATVPRSLALGGGYQAGLRIGAF